jgi:hypothetical protein
VSNIESIITETEDIASSSSYLVSTSFKRLLVIYFDALAKDFHYSTFSVLLLILHLRLRLRLRLRLLLLLLRLRLRLCLRLRLRL